MKTNWKPPAQLNHLLAPKMSFADWEPIESAPSCRCILVRNKNLETFIAAKMPIQGFSPFTDEDACYWEVRIGPVRMEIAADSLESWCWIPGVALV